MLAYVDTQPFQEIGFAKTANASLGKIQWSATHQYGVLLYCPASHRQAHIRLNHHLIGIELDPGIVSLQIDDSPLVTRVLKSRTFYFVPAGSTIEVRKETPIEHMLLTFDPRFCHRLPVLPDHPVDDMADHEFASTALAIRRQFLTGGPVSQLATRLADVSMAALSRAYQSRAYRNALTPVRYRLNTNRVSRALNYIGEHCFRKITVEEVAGAVGGISGCHFAHAFEFTLGQSPYQYILEQRVRRAREMLMHGSISIAEVAYSVGFSSQAHMTETFSRRLGITPAQIRTSPD